MKAGDTIENPVTGEKMTFLVTGNEAAGQLLQIDMAVRSGGFAAAEHIHPSSRNAFRSKRAKSRSALPDTSNSTRLETR